MDFKRSSREVRAQVVYAGTGLGGKTTNLEYLHKQYNRGRLSGVSTEGERTLLFDFLAVNYAILDGWSLRFNLLTVPGQAQYRASRKLALKNPDGIVFVADSDPNRFDANLYAMDDLQRVLAELDHDASSIPIVIQYNKRDLPGACSVADLQAALNPGGAPAVVASALKGVGVFKTIGLMMEIVRDRVVVQLAPQLQQ